MKIYSKNKIERITKDSVKKHLENHGVCFGDLDSLLLDDILRCYDNDAKKLLRSYNILKSESQNILFGETLTDFDIYYSSAHGIPIVHETLSILYEIPPYVMWN